MRQVITYTEIHGYKCEREDILYIGVSRAFSLFPLFFFPFYCFPWLWWWGVGGKGDPSLAFILNQEIEDQFPIWAHYQNFILDAVDQFSYILEVSYPSLPCRLVLATFLLSFFFLINFFSFVELSPISYFIYVKAITFIRKDIVGMSLPQS